MSWLKRRSKNQRVRQRNVLAVKSSTAQLRRHRFRVFFYTTAASAAVCFSLYLCWRVGEWVLNRFVYQNQAYALHTLDVQTDGVIAPEQIRRWADVRLGDNLFVIDLTRVKRDLELVPAIQRVAVERCLPGTLRIHAQEREPVAQINTTVVRSGAAPQTTVFLLDAEGYVMLPLEARQRAFPVTASEQYPVITGVNPVEMVPGRRVESPQIHAALRLITTFAHSPMAGVVDLRRISVSSSEVLAVATDQQSEVCLRTQDLERQLGRWRLVHDLGVRQGRQIGSLDLSVTDNIPLRWMATASLPPSLPKVQKTSPYRKKHV
jgi:cell division septal protein FtsQ